VLSFGYPERSSNPEGQSAEEWIDHRRQRRSGGARDLGGGGRCRCRPCQGRGPGPRDRLSLRDEEWGASRAERHARRRPLPSSGLIAHQARGRRRDLPGLPHAARAAGNPRRKGAHHPAIEAAAGAVGHAPSPTTIESKTNNAWACPAGICLGRACTPACAAGRPSRRKIGRRFSLYASIACSRGTGSRTRSGSTISLIGDGTHSEVLPCDRAKVGFGARGSRNQAAMVAISARPPGYCARACACACVCAAWRRAESRRSSGIAARARAVRAADCAQQWQRWRLDRSARRACRHHPPRSRRRAHQVG
jgi:hypothetical protein